MSIEWTVAIIIYLLGWWVQIANAHDYGLEGIELLGVAAITLIWPIGAAIDFVLVVFSTLRKHFEKEAKKL